MPDLRLTGSINFNKGGASLSRTVSSSLDISGSKFTSLVQNIGTMDETISLGEVGTIGYVMAKNLDGSNFVTLGEDGSSYPIKLLPGESMGPVRWNGVAIHALADTGACDIQVDIVEE